MRNKHPFVIVGVITLLFIVGIFYTIHYFSSSRLVSLSMTHVDSLTLTNSDVGNAKGKEYPSTINSLRVKKNTNYRLSYTGTSDYADGSVTITPETEKITINPDYSAEKLSSMLATELPTIQSVIRATYPTVDQLYILNTGNLVHYGEWYFTTLSYKGSFEDESSDTLVVGLQKNNGTWELTLTPNIVFTVHDYPNVSRVFINAANQYHTDYVTPSEE